MVGSSENKVRQNHGYKSWRIIKSKLKKEYWSPLVYIPSHHVFKELYHWTGEEVRSSKKQEHLFLHGLNFLIVEKFSLPGWSAARCMCLCATGSSNPNLTTICQQSGEQGRSHDATFQMYTPLQFKQSLVFYWTFINIYISSDLNRCNDEHLNL